MAKENFPAGFVLLSCIFLVFLTRYSLNSLQHPRSSACIRGHSPFFVPFASSPLRAELFGCGSAAPGSSCFSWFIYRPTSLPKVKCNRHCLPPPLWHRHPADD